MGLSRELTVDGLAFEAAPHPSAPRPRRRESGWSRTRRSPTQALPPGLGAASRRAGALSALATAGGLVVSRRASRDQDQGGKGERLVCHPSRLTSSIRRGNRGFPAQLCRDRPTRRSADYFREVRRERLDATQATSAPIRRHHPARRGSLLARGVRAVRHVLPGPRVSTTSSITA